MVVYSPITNVMQFNESTKTFGQLLKNLRNRRGWSGERLAEEAGLTQGAVSKYENGERHPKRDTIRRLSNALNVPPDEMLAAAGFASEEIIGELDIEYMVDLSELTIEGMNDYELPEADLEKAKRAATRNARQTFISVAEALREARADDPGVVPGAGPVKETKHSE